MYMRIEKIFSLLCLSIIPTTFLLSIQAPVSSNKGGGGTPEVIRKSTLKEIVSVFKFC